MEKKYTKGEIVFDENDNLDFVYKVKSGVIKVTKLTTEGNERLVDIVGEGDYLAAILYIKKQSKYNLNALVLKNATLEKYSINEFEEHLSVKENRNKLLLYSAKKAYEFKSLLEETGDINTHILKCLSNLVDKFKDNKNDNFAFIPLSMVDIASFIGIRRETLSRKIKVLKEENLIEISNKIIKIL